MLVLGADTSSELEESLRTVVHLEGSQLGAALSDAVEIPADVDLSAQEDVKRALARIRQRERERQLNRQRGL